MSRFTQPHTSNRPDLSTVTSDGPVFAEPSTRLTPVEAQRRDDESRLGRQFNAELEARDRKIAADFGIDYDIFSEMSEDQRTRAINRVRKQGPLPQETKDAPALYGDENSMTAQFARKSAGMITRDESKDWVILCDPIRDDPIWGKYTPGLSRIPVGALDAKKDQGFTEYPIAPFKPDPMVGPCALFRADGLACDFMAYADPDDATHSTQMEDHQQAIHPRAYKARQDRIERERNEKLLELQRQQVELARQQLAQKVG